MVKRRYNGKKIQSITCDSDSGVSIDSSPGCSKENLNCLLGPPRVADVDWCRNFQKFDIKLNSKAVLLLKDIYKKEVSTLTGNSEHLETKVITATNCKNPDGLIDVDIISMNPSKKPKLFKISINLDGNGTRKLNGQNLDFRPETPVPEVSDEEELTEESSEYSSSSDDDLRKKPNVHKLEQQPVPIQQNKQRVCWNTKLDVIPLHLTSEHFFFKNVKLESDFLTNNQLNSSSPSCSRLNKIISPESCVSDIKDKSPITKTSSPRLSSANQFNSEESNNRFITSLLSSPSSVNKIITPEKSCLSEIKDKSPMTSPRISSGNYSNQQISNKRNSNKVTAVKKLDFPVTFNNSDTINNNANYISSNSTQLSNKEDVSIKFNGESFNITKTVFCGTSVSPKKYQDSEVNATTSEQNKTLPLTTSNIKSFNSFNERLKQNCESVAVTSVENDSPSKFKFLVPNDLANKLSRNRNQVESQSRCSETFKVPKSKVIEPSQVNTFLREDIDIIKQRIFPRVRDDDELSIFVDSTLLGDLDDFSSINNTILDETDVGDKGSGGHNGLNNLDDDNIAPTNELPNRNLNFPDSEHNGFNSLVDNNIAPTNQLPKENYNFPDSYIDDRLRRNKPVLNHFPYPPPNFYNGNHQPVLQFEENPYYNGVELMPRRYNNSRLPPSPQSTSSDSNQYAPNRSNFVHVPPIRVIRTLCHYDPCLKGESCKYYHKLPPKFYNSLLTLNLKEVQEIQAWISKKHYPKELIISVLFNLIDYYGEKKLYNDLLNITSDIRVRRDVGLIKPFIQKVIRTLTNRMEVDYDEAIREIAGYNKRDVFLTDILLDIIVKENDLFEKYWGTLQYLTRCRTEILDVGVLEDILRKCTWMQKNDLNRKKYFVSVCQDLLLKTFVDITKINEELLRQYVNVLHKLDTNCSEKLNSIYLECRNVSLITNFASNIGQDKSNVPNSSVNQVVTLKPPIKPSITDEDITLLGTAIRNVKTNEVVPLIQKYKNQEYTMSLIAHFTVLLRKMKLHIFHTFLMDLINKLEKSFGDRDIKRTMEQISFNVLPYYDTRADYNLASQIIFFFMRDFQSFISSNSKKNISADYKNIFKSKPDQIIFLVKLLVKGDFLKEAFELIQLKECELFDMSDQSWYNYKIAKLKLFIDKALASKYEIFTKLVLYFLKHNSEKIIVDLNIREHYNFYLTKLLEGSLKDKTPLLREYKNILPNLCHITEKNLRVIIISMFTDNEVNNLAQIYSHCCERRIYFEHNGSERAIIMKSDMTTQEINLIVTMFFQKMLALNYPAKRIEIKVVAVTPNTPKAGSDKLQSLFPENCSRGGLILRVACVFYSLVPTVMISDRAFDDKFELTEEDVRLCHQRFRCKQQ